MAYQTLTIRPDDGEEYALEVTARDALVWERTSKDQQSILQYLSYPSMTQAYRLAHIVAKRTGRFSGSLKEFEEQHDLAFKTMITEDDVEQEPEQDPTRSAASADD